MSTNATGEVILATTTSLEDSGLLDVLLPMFEEQTDYQLKPISVGSGAALALGARGEADVVFVHAPEAEREWMAEGYGTERLLVMYNDFVIVGPPSDPAGIAGKQSVVAALQAIAADGAAWVSRDDNSGTDQLTAQLWSQAGIDADDEPWHVVSGQGMAGTLTLADQQDAYTLTDRGTYLALRPSLLPVILIEGDRLLLNPYHVIPVDPAAFPDVSINHEGAQAFAGFLLDPNTQRVIGDYGRDEYGESLFHPAAGLTEEQLDH